MQNLKAKIYEAKLLRAEPETGIKETQVIKTTNN